MPQLNSTLLEKHKLLTEQFLPDIHRHRCCSSIALISTFTAEAIQEKIRASGGKHTVNFGAASRGYNSIVFMQGLDKVAHSLQTFYCCLSSEHPS